MRVEFFIDLKEGCGYRKPCEIHETTEITVSFDAKSVACAQRQLKALVKDDVIDGYSVNCFDMEYNDLSIHNKELESHNYELSKTCHSYSETILGQATTINKLSNEICDKNTYIDELETELQQYKAIFASISNMVGSI